MNIGIYYRKLFFFAFLGLVVFGVGKVVGSGFSFNFNRTIEASINEDLPNESKKLDNFIMTIELQKDGSAQVGDEKMQLVKPTRNNLDEMRFLVFDKPRLSHQTAEIKVVLPGPIERLAEDPQIIAVHGASPEKATFENNTITYKARDIMESSTVTIVAKFQKGYFALPGKQELNRTIDAIPGLVWFFGGIILPPIALILLLTMFFGSRFQLKRRKIAGFRNAPPKLISPALASILYHGHVTPRAIMAMLIDLGRRGFIEIYNKGDDFYIYRHQVTKRLAATLDKSEFYLLDKIFLPKQKKVDNVDVEERIARHIFSRKIALVFLDIYNDGGNFGYFKNNPFYIHLKYRMIGILTFFVGLMGYIIFAVFSPDPKFILFLWIALVLMGMVMVNLAPALTGFSEKGAFERDEWIKFRNFLTEKKLVDGYDEYFERYLPYAIALGAEAEWAGRFANANFAMPKWYGFSGDIEGVENFARSFLPVLQIISNELTASSDPLVR